MEIPIIPPTSKSGVFLAIKTFLAKSYKPSYILKIGKILIDEFANILNFLD